MIGLLVTEKLLLKLEVNLTTESIGYDYGIAMLKRFLAEHNLNHIVVDIPQERTFSVLDARGEFAIDDPATNVNTLWGNGIDADLVTPYIFSDKSKWGNATEHDEVKIFFLQIGRQLFVNYLQSQVLAKGWIMWSDAKIDKCAYGMWNLGLVTAFGHSVPKATIPLFWASWPVSLHRKKIDLDFYTSKEGAPNCPASRFGAHTRR